MSTVTANKFNVEKTVRFAHCDPAGIIFYPRYFDLLHEVKEDWFREALKQPFEQFITRLGLGFPIVKLGTDFFAPSKLGEALTFELWVAEIGRSSLHLHYSCSSNNQLRMRARTVIVQMAFSDGKSRSLADDLRVRINNFMAGRPNL